MACLAETTRMRFETGMKHPHPKACVEMQNKRLPQQVASSTHPNSNLNVMWSTKTTDGARFGQALACLICCATPWASYKLLSAGSTEHSISDLESGFVP